MSRSPKSQRFFLSIGSNLEPQKNISACLEILKEKLTVKKISSIYETEPVGPAGKEKFWNLAVEIETLKSKEALTKILRRIEDQIGRKRNPSDKFSPRTIDIDILPQPDFRHQAFIIIPLAEIAAEEKDPETGRSFKELAGKMDSKRMVRKITRTGRRTWRKEQRLGPY